MDDKVKRLLEREGTGISWADLTFNPWIGCQKVSPACDHCYAEGLATSRLGVQWGPGAERRKTAKGTWQKLARWQRIAAEAGVTLTVFSGSLCDIFDNAVDDSWRIQLGAEIVAAPNLLFMLLTKRIGNAREMLEAMFPEGVPANVALGVTISSQPEAERDLPRAISVKHGLGIGRLFISGEPLLGPLDLSRWLGDVDLVIIGGESGVGARAMDVQWARVVRGDCTRTGTPFHFKQWGEWLPGGQGNPNGVDLNRYEVLIEGEPPDAVEKAYRVGVRNAGHYLDHFEHREHFK